MAKVKVRIELDRTWVLAVGVSLVAPHVAETTRAVLNRARVTTPKDTGNLANSLTMTIRARRTSVSGIVQTRVKYATFVHNGTKPHIIRARRAGALRFFWPKVGLVTVVPKLKGGLTGVVRTKHGSYFRIGKGFVNHPGTKARPWLYEALRHVAEKDGYTVTRLGLGAPEEL